MAVLLVVSREAIAPVLPGSHPRIYLTPPSNISHIGRISPFAPWFRRDAACRVPKIAFPSIHTWGMGAAYSDRSAIALSLLSLWDVKALAAYLG
ncbi:hypothetical protein CKA32_006940 [Geitlerinema sp. FC II]|nr:hypothetical protein CKA32_006940 [Geitlerinema sp. FC II]